MPASAAIQPAWRPITSHTITRWWDSAVVASRSIASVAVCTAVWKPKVTSVPDRSLSIVLGTPTARTPIGPSRLATPKVSSPPMTTSASMRSAAKVRRTRSTPSGSPKGLVREVPSTVPPIASSPVERSGSSAVERPSRTPRQPSR